MNQTYQAIDSRNDMPQRLRDTLIPVLNEQLAATFDLYSQVKQAQWNVKGMQFMSLRLLFNELAASLTEFIDDIAERIAALGGRAMGTVRITAERSYLADLPPDVVQATQVATILAGRFAQYVAAIRALSQKADDYGDRGTAGMLTTILLKVDKHIWLLEAHLQMGA